MGDRTSVNLYVLSSQAERVVELLGSVEEHPEERFTGTREGEAPTHTHLYFSEVNYGELAGLELLEEEGIAYDSEWSNGSEYGSGTSYCRFSPEGKMESSVQYDDQLNPPLGALMDRIEDSEGLKAYILDFSKKLEVRSWDNQEEYGRLYRTLRLIGATK